MNTKDTFTQSLEKEKLSPRHDPIEKNIGKVFLHYLLEKEFVVEENEEEQI